MKYILSKYTYIFFENGKYFLFNSQSLLFIEISQSLYNKLSSPSIHFNGEKDDLFLIDKKIIINEDNNDDFFYDQKVKSSQAFYSNDSISLVLIPCTGCNFACPYCFENHKPENYMSDMVIDKLCIFIKDHKDAKSLDLTWYGGEPLLGFNVIQKIFAKFETELNIPINKHSIVTNGYLLSDEVIAFFKKNKLDNIQITLDGLEENHNKTRRLKNTGEPTYKRIIDNIGKIIEAWPNTDIKIRVNVEALYCDDFIKVYNNIISLYGKERLNIYPGFIRKDNPEKNNFDCGEMWKYQQQKLFLKLYDMGVYSNCYPKHITKGCMVNHINSYIIGPNGEIYKCWNDVGNKSRIIGYIDQEKLTNKSLFSKYMAELSCFEDEKCKNCLFFPICSGGCSWYRFKNKYNNGKYNICTIHKDNDMLKKYLMIHYHKILSSK